jgi:hypothetical protein
MKFSIQVILILFLGFTCYSQNRDFKIYFHKNNSIKPKLDSIDFESFNRIRRIGISSGPLIQSIYLPDEINRAADSIWKANKVNKGKNAYRMDSLVRLTKQNYPSAFYEKGTCLILNGSDQKIEICKHKSDNMKASTFYEFKDYTNNYFVIEKSGFESWEFILFNPQTRNYKYIEHKPCFMNDSIAYCSDNYYGEGGFEIMHMFGKFYFGFESYNWELEECYRVDKVFYLSFRSNYNRNMKPKYVRINFNKCF